MNRPATWKVVTVGAALTGLGIVGAGTAAASTMTVPAPASIEVVTEQVPATFVALGDDWTETYWDDNASNNQDWTDTYWDD